MNGLSPKERELLTMLAEEAGEIVQAVAKILRHGPDSWNPDEESGPTNSEHLRKEIVDILAVVQLMRESDRPLLSEMAQDPNNGVLYETMLRKQRYMHTYLGVVSP